MPVYEYRVIPAPKRGIKGKGVGSASAARFAHAMELLMNDMGRDGWDYVRADTLPCEERQGLTGRTTVFQNMLVFRKVEETVTEALAPRIAIPAPVVQPPALAAPTLRLADPLPGAPALGPAERFAAE
jgi:hypothetical protein